MTIPCVDNLTDTMDWSKLGGRPPKDPRAGQIDYDLGEGARIVAHDRLLLGVAQALIFALPSMAESLDRASGYRIRRNEKPLIAALASASSDLSDCLPPQV